jgi:hypothetical protein
MSLKNSNCHYRKNLHVWNESLIHKKFISGNVPCEVSVDVKHTASFKESGAQNQNLFFIYEEKRSASSAKCRGSGSVLLRVNSVQQLSISAKIKLLFEWPV